MLKQIVFKENNNITDSAEYYLLLQPTVLEDVDTYDFNPDNTFVLLFTSLIDDLDRIDEENEITIALTSTQTEDMQYIFKGSKNLLSKNDCLVFKPNSDKFDTITLSDTFRYNIYRVNNFLSGGKYKNFYLDGTGNYQIIINNTPFTLGENGDIEIDNRINIQFLGVLPPIDTAEEDILFINYEEE